MQVSLFLPFAKMYTDKVQAWFDDMKSLLAEGEEEAEEDETAINNDIAKGAEMVARK